MAENVTHYEEQLLRVNAALEVTNEAEDRQNLLSLQEDLQQLINLYAQDSVLPEPVLDTPDIINSLEATKSADEYANFMSEMQRCGALQETVEDEQISLQLSSLEGTRCRAPYKHSWGSLEYHNAFITTVYPSRSADSQEIQVKVLFTNPTHKEMQPCPYFLDPQKECRFTDEKCRYSHGELVNFTSLVEYIEPDFASIEVGSQVLVKQDDLWQPGCVRRILSNKQVCDVKLNERKEVQVGFSDLLPLPREHNMHDVDDTQSDRGSESGTELDDSEREDFINISLLTNPSEDKLGSWEKHTKGIGSKLMQKMGYIIGTGLGRRGEGRIEPVTAIALPSGKSLDHCMELREKSGGDKNLFNVERKLKRLQRKQEQKNLKAYKRMKSNEEKNVFNFLNKSLQLRKMMENEGDSAVNCKSQHRKEIQKETSRNLNVESFKLEQRMKEIENELLSIKLAINRHQTSQVSLQDQLRDKLIAKQNEFAQLQEKLQNIKNEQSLRNSTRILTTF